MDRHAALLLVKVVTWSFSLLSGHHLPSLVSWAGGRNSATGGWDGGTGWRLGGWDGVIFMTKDTVDRPCHPAFLRICLSDSSEAIQLSRGYLATPFKVIPFSVARYVIGIVTGIAFIRLSGVKE